MARSSASVPPPRRTQYLWPTALVLTFLVFAAPLVSGTTSGPLAVVIYVVVALSDLALLVGLRGQFRKARSEAASHLRDAGERADDTARLDAEWRRRSQQQNSLIQAEVEHVVKERLPAALDGRQDPGPLSGGWPLDETVAGLLDRLLAEVHEAVEHREESQRLALVELASRVQTSAHRIQAAVTGLADRYPTDAELLESTMQVDHAATQQARHAQSLKVLCGEWPGQQWQKPLALVDAVRAASGRIVAYTRIEVSGDPDVGIAAPVVEPLIHLMAELLANATEYSPPSTAVPVTVRTVQRGAVIEVDDGGLGLDEYRLAEAREVASGRRLLGVGDVGEIPQTGFAVVGRFAQRHGFHVDLGPSPYGGVRGVVLIPTDVLETIAPAGSSADRSLVVPPPASPPGATAGTTEGAGPAPTVPGQASRTPATVYGEEHAPRPAPDTTAPGPGADDAPGHARHAAPDPSRAGRLPRRRSRRDEFRPGTGTAGETAAPAMSSATPDEAGDWMEAFFEGGRSVPDPRSGPHVGEDGSSPHTPDSIEGQA
ncbi:ATP-binding protein [Streptomyces sp. A 4/2]|uniref:ATP-binding protein n=1 Tax=Streptomyces sp. A 4/2 TaxID=2934314 RepID=UPI0020240833|nr:ATP-binding protein [Streptomyces sp. A 4/2]